MHWGGLGTFPPAPAGTSAFFIFSVPDTPLHGKLPPEIGRMAFVETTASPPLNDGNSKLFHVLLSAERDSLDGLLAGGVTGDISRIRLLTDRNQPAFLDLPLTPAARFSIESIRRCPFAGACRDLALTARGLDLLAEFISALWQTAEPSANPHLPFHDTLSQVRTAAEKLQTALEHPPSIAELAGAVGLSESTLKRGFRQLYQTTPFGYLRARRMEHARELLSTGKATVLEAAAFVGYSNPSNFAAAFRKQFGVNPKTFQMSARR